jgi:hypothetical protein
VKAGNNVVLYTGSGTNSETKNPGGSTNHFFYWAMKQTVFQDADATVVVFEVQDWQTGMRPGPTPAK